MSEANISLVVNGISTGLLPAFQSRVNAMDSAYLGQMFTLHEGWAVSVLCLCGKATAFGPGPYEVLNDVAPGRGGLPVCAFPCPLCERLALVGTDEVTRCVYQTSGDRHTVPCAQAHGVFDLPSVGFVRHRFHLEPGKEYRHDCKCGRMTCFVSLPSSPDRVTRHGFREDEVLMGVCSHCQEPAWVPSNGVLAGLVDSGDAFPLVPKADTRPPTLQEAMMRQIGKNTDRMIIGEDTVKAFEGMLKEDLEQFVCLKTALHQTFGDGFGGYAVPPGFDLSSVFTVEELKFMEVHGILTPAIVAGEKHVAIPPPQGFSLKRAAEAIARGRLEEAKTEHMVIEEAKRAKGGNCRCVLLPEQQDHNTGEGLPTARLVPCLRGLVWKLRDGAGETRYMGKSLVPTLSYGGPPENTAPDYFPDEASAAVGYRRYCARRLREERKEGHNKRHQTFGDQSNQCGVNFAHDFTVQPLSEKDADDFRKKWDARHITHNPGRAQILPAMNLKDLERQYLQAGPPVNMERLFVSEFPPDQWTTTEAEWTK